MKINRGLIIISMIIISLLAVGVVSASENVSDVIETTDYDEVISVDDNIDDAVAIVAEYRKTGDQFWCHAGRSWVEDMREASKSVYEDLMKGVK